MMAGEASIFPRIDPDDPLAQAARIVNDHAAANTMPATLEWLGIGATPEQVAYLAEQRALRAIAAATLGAADVDETICQAIIQTPLWRDMRPLLVGCYLDGIAIGYHAAQIVTGVGAAGDDTPDHFEGNIGANIAGGRHETSGE